MKFSAFTAPHAAYVSIVREVKEETGFITIIDRIITAYLIDIDPRGNSIDIVYSGKVMSGKLQLREHSDGKFFSWKNLPDPIAYKHRDVITEWFKKDKTHLIL